MKKYFPSKDDIVKYIHTVGQETAQRDIAKAFNIKKSDRAAFKRFLSAIQDEGLWDKPTRREQKKAFHRAKKLTSKTTRRMVLPCVITKVLSPGKYELELSKTHTQVEERILLDLPNERNLTEGRRLLARLEKGSNGVIKATPIKFFGHPIGERNKVIGVYQVEKGKGYVYPATRKEKHPYLIALKDSRGARDGDIVHVTPHARSRQKQAEITAILGNIYEPKGLSLISILQNDIEMDFSHEAQREALTASVPTLSDREDLRDYDLVTIDGEDARDFDDAVFAEKTDTGFHVIVAIADVAHYVLPGSELDKAARKRGNSIYFPDRVVPMLPEKLSNDLCSLRPNEDRACLAVHIYLDEQGKVLSSKFVRGLMRSKARLTYQQAQAIHDESLSSDLSSTLKPLYEVYNTLLNLRSKRGALEIELPEYRITLDQETGEVESVGLRHRLDSHKLIEELMILANVCAAKTLESKNHPCVFRIHPAPSEAKVLVLRDYLHSIKVKAPKSELATPHEFNEILRAAIGKPHQTVINELVLRTQQQALYSTKNEGHFGLSLTHYAHFTSPIRRYADLIIHRSLISALGLGGGGLPHKTDISELSAVAEDISIKERQAEQAEREVVDRYLSLYLVETGKLHYEGVITSIRPFGAFIKITENGIVGMALVASLPDFFVYHESEQMLHGRESGITLRLGDKVNVTLEDVDVLTGQINFKLDIKTSYPSQNKQRKN